MRRLALISAVFAIVLSCAETIDQNNTDGGYQDTDVPDTAPVWVFDFTDAKNNPVDVTEVIIMSDALEVSPVIIRLDAPAKNVKMDVKRTVNQIASYHFFVTGANGKTYHALKDLYLPNGRRYEKSIELTRSAPTLLTDRSSWKVTTVREGLVWYNFEGHEQITNAKQVINVLEFDLTREDLKLEFLYFPDRAKISEVAQGDAGLVAIANASFGSGFTSGSPVDNTYIRVHGVTYREIGLSPDDSYYGKHESAVWYDGVSEIGFIDMPGDLNAELEYYKSTTYPNLFSSYPMLIKDFKKVDFSAYKKKVSKTSVDPRTILGVTYDGKLIIMTVDGRWTDKATGMTLPQMQDFLMMHFFPKYAINMDGGGSTSMFIKGENVVNYPCEGVSSSSPKKYTGTFKERGLVTYFGIREIK